MDERLDTLEERFDRHLEIYAANGKESKRVADNLERLIEQNNEMYEVFRDFKGGSRIIKYIFGSLAALGGLWVIWIKITKG